MGGRETNIDIFLDTKRLCRTDKDLIDAIGKSNINQFLIKEEDVVDVVRHKYEKPASVIVSRKRSLEAAEAYSDSKVCVHNFASATNPGGGVERGSSAQEEAICRCSSLYFNLIAQDLVDEFYKKHRHALQTRKMTSCYNDDCIYTPGVCVLKADTAAPAVLPKEKWYNVDVITCAAPNMRERTNNLMNPGPETVPLKLSDEELLTLHIKRMSRICDIAIRENAEVIVLGAFGCGAFKNPPLVVAEAMARVVEAYEYDFKVIEFAVYCSPRDTENYEAFSNIIKSDVRNRYDQAKGKRH